MFLLQYNPTPHRVAGLKALPHSVGAVRSYFGSTGFGTPGQLVQIDAIAYAE
jgi:hypothetical protein